MDPESRAAVSPSPSSLAPHREASVGIAAASSDLTPMVPRLVWLPLACRRPREVTLGLHLGRPQAFDNGEPEG
jgi:hypothetical protein